MGIYAESVALYHGAACLNIALMQLQHQLGLFNVVNPDGGTVYAVFLRQLPEGGAGSAVKKYVSVCHQPSSFAHAWQMLTAFWGL